jgi:hypothetical protein
MKQQFKLITALLSISSVFLLTGLILNQVTVNADSVSSLSAAAQSQLALTPEDYACNGAGIAGASCNAKASAKTLNTTIQNIINIFSAIIGVVAVLMIIFAGFKFITAGGEAKNIATARQSIVYALVGLAVVALAQIIVDYVLVKV